MTEDMKLSSLNEDTIQCLFFLSSPNTDIVFWETLCDNINDTIQTLSKDYLWHRDELKLYSPILNKDISDAPSHLTSTTCFGDNIEDEWFITYLILEITKLYQDVIVQVKDNDGDFLLIEAADCLPSWANPDNTENRVFIYNNCIHVITPEVADLDSDLHLEDAIKFVADVNLKTESYEIQNAILKRIGNYPDKIKENIHRTWIKLPLDLATLLTLKPSLISPITRTYCNHDIIDAKACRNIKLEHCTNVKVKFTKCQYAMLIHSKLIKNLLKTKLKQNDKKAMLGLKLTCGYEMIMGKLSQDVFSTKEYSKFIQSLTENGYFKENIEGSRNYTELLQKARKFFLQMECPINLQVCNEITQLMATDEFHELKGQLKNKCVPEKELIDDNEDWFNIDPEELNNLLNKKYGKQPGFKKDDNITPQILTSELTNFLKESSDFEGIELNNVGESEDNNIEFDSDEFVNSLKNMLNLISSENSDMNGHHCDGSEDNMVHMENDDLDRELQSKLNIYQQDDAESSKEISLNIIQSMKEEKGLTGPSSNILRTIGINKIDLLDSDDD